ncbi:hypothetical protein [Moorena producens]
MERWGDGEMHLFLLPTPYSLLPTGCISFLLFDKVVRYGAGCLNPGA